MAPDIIVKQPPIQPETDVAEAEPKTRSEADLRGILENDSFTDDERAQMEAERLLAEEAAKLRREDYQLAYAIDILRGLSVLGAQK